MVRQGIWTPLGVLAAGLTIIIALLAQQDGPTSARPAASNHYPAQTQTSSAKTQTAQAEYPAPQTSTPTVSRTPATASATPADVDGATSTPTPTASRLVPSATPTVPLTRVDPLPPTPMLPAPTPTPADHLTCVPGVPIAIIGVGPPRAALLLYFGQRAVGGRSADAEGRFSIPLVVGNERPGTYTVTVRVRGTNQVLREVTCAVPPTTPTPTPTRRP